MVVICVRGCGCTGCMSCYDDGGDDDFRIIKQPVCIVCGRTEDEAGEITDGYCEECANEELAEQAAAIAVAERIGA